MTIMETRPILDAAGQMQQRLGALVASRKGDASVRLSLHRWGVAGRMVNVFNMALEVDGRPLDGEFVRTAMTINTMVDQLRNVPAEVTRVARELGTEGKLGGRAKVPGAAGTCKALSENVSQLAARRPRGRDLPMVAVTAKAMKGDRQKCIEAGAWQYLSKPVDPRQLMAVMREWQCR